jgi:hypothetical protein
VLSAQNHDVSSTPVIVDRDNITIRGAGADSKGTKLVRGLNYKGALLQIGTLAKSVSGVKIENMTVCGGSKIGHNWIEPENAEGCPRPAGLTLNACERDTRNATLYPKVSPGNCAKDQRACQYPDGTPPAAAFCTDVQVIRSAAASAGSYAVEFTGVQMLDAPGHALSVRGYRNDTDTVKYKTDDIWFRNGAIHRSGITGLLIGSDGKGYTRKFCDSYPNFADSPDIVTPRNIRIENSDFDDNNTGVIGAGTRRVYFGGNRLRRNYIWPQAQGGDSNNLAAPDVASGDPNLSAGGTLMFDHCSDQIQIVNNATFVGPGANHQRTQALELYSRNTTVQNNVFTGYTDQGIAAFSMLGGSILNNTITMTSPSLAPDGGITIASVGGSGPCSSSPPEIYRETNGLTVSGNTISGQAFGIHLAEHPWQGTAALNGLSVGTNYLNWTENAILKRAFVWANPSTWYSGSAYMAPTLGPRVPFLGATPRTLPVEVDASSSSERALCSTPGAARAPFTIAAADDSNGSDNHPDYGPPGPDYGDAGYSGANQIARIEGVFSSTSSTSRPAGPSNTPQDCHFVFIAHLSQPVVYLDDGTANWPSSPLGPPGRDLTAPGCIIHAQTSLASTVQTGQYVRSVTLDVEFRGGASTKHLFVFTTNKNNISSYEYYDESQPDQNRIWKYWGWWHKP